MRLSEMLGQRLTYVCGLMTTWSCNCSMHVAAAGKEGAPQAAYLLGCWAVLPAHQRREALEEGPPARGAARRRSLLLRFSRPGRPFHSLHICSCLELSSGATQTNGREVQIPLPRQAERLQLSTHDWGPARQTPSSAVRVVTGGVQDDNSQLCTPVQEAGGWGPAEQAR